MKGKILSWQGKYAESAVILEDLYEKVFDNYDLILALSDVWVGLRSYDEAMDMVNYGLSLFPNDPDLLLKKAQLYQLTGSIDQANSTLYSVLALRPNDPVATRALNVAKGAVPITGISAEYTHNRYTIPFARYWNMYSMRYYHTTELGTFIGSVNMGYVNTGNTPFMQNGGVQFEIDAYPKFPAQKRYFHLNYGYSPSAVFARHRLGAHIYNEFGSGWEGSAGFNNLFGV